MPRARLKSGPPSADGMAMLQAAQARTPAAVPPKMPAATVNEVIASKPDADDLVTQRELSKLSVDLRLVMLRDFQRRGLNTASWLQEVHATARVAAMEGDFSASFKGYEILGKHLGALTGDTHLHLHAPAVEQMREMSDAQLQAWISQAENTAKEIEATVHTPEAEELFK